MLKQSKVRAEHRGGTKIRFVWACGTKRTKDYSKGRVSQRMGEQGVRMMVRYWRGGLTTTGNPCPVHGRFCGADEERRAEPKPDAPPPAGQVAGVGDCSRGLR